MKCKSKSRNVMSGQGDGGEEQDEMSMRKRFQAGRELDVNSIQQQ